jgi:hypothetical protein
MAFREDVKILMLPLLPYRSFFTRSPTCVSRSPMCASMMRMEKKKVWVACTSLIPGVVRYVQLIQDIAMIQGARIAVTQGQGSHLARTTLLSLSHVIAGSFIPGFFDPGYLARRDCRPLSILACPSELMDLHICTEHRSRKVSDMA